MGILDGSSHLCVSCNPLSFLRSSSSVRQSSVDKTKARRFALGWAVEARPLSWPSASSAQMSPLPVARLADPERPGRAGTLSFGTISQTKGQSRGGRLNPGCLCDLPPWAAGDGPDKALRLGAVPGHCAPRGSGYCVAGDVAATPNRRGTLAFAVK